MIARIRTFVKLSALGRSIFLCMFFRFSFDLYNIATLFLIVYFLYKNMEKHDGKVLCYSLSLSRFCFIILLLGFTLGTYAYNLRQFSSKNGLSNSAILSLCQDSHGTVWIGTCDGLNIYDGTYLGVYKSANIYSGLSGNLIERVMEGKKNELWIQTNYGLDQLDTHRQSIQRFCEFKDISPMATTSDGESFMLKDDGYVYYYQPKTGVFCRLNMEKIDFDEVCEMTVDKWGILWIFSSNNDNRSYKIEKKEDTVFLLPCNYFSHAEKICSAFVEEDMLYFIDDTHALYEFEFQSRKTYFIADLEDEINLRGEISSVVKLKDDYFVGFKSSGLIQLRFLPDSKIRYVVQQIDIQSGIFCLMRDKFQDLIWVGTDGQGLYMYYSDDFSIRNVLLNTPEYRINNPVRALFLDHEHTLWVGTKGGGILRMKNYHPMTENTAAVEKVLANNSELIDNTVYCFVPGQRERLWIGTEKGLSYYSYHDQKIKSLAVFADGKPLKYVHSICEPNDSTLWIATVGEGVVKVSLDNSHHLPKIRSTKRFVLDGGRKSSNYFFVSYQESDSIIWFGNRGYGAYRMNIRTEQMQPYSLDSVIHNQTVNDIFAIHKNDEGYWFGTSFGLIRMYQGDCRVYNGVDGFPNNTIHGILEGQNGHLWLSTNQGIVKFNVRDATVQAYRLRGDSEVTEFCDGAYFKDEVAGTLFFGGINGFVAISESEFVADDYMPKLHFTHLSVFGKECNLYDYLQDREKQVLILDAKQNFFNLSFSVVDYVNGNNYTYSYKMDSLSDNWVENGLSATAVFSNLPPGDYMLRIKYRNNITGRESEPYSLAIHITPSWYQTGWAKTVYCLLSLLFVIGCIRIFIVRYRKKRSYIVEQMNRQQKEELYESKLRFFTNITHEFCTPLTLINGPCEKILSYSKVDGYVRKYALMIQQNAMKLNALILELIEFRRLETGNRIPKIESVCIADQIKVIAESFIILAENQKLDYHISIEAGCCWNTDISCLSKIVNNLISNAFKYTPMYGRISVEVFVENCQLCIRITNTGKGIKEEDLPKIFDRYKILDNFEVQNKNGISPRNGLGLAICHSMVNLLKGQIKVSSVLNQQTIFEVYLPELEVSVNTEKEKDSTIILPSFSTDSPSVEQSNPVAAYDKNKQTVMIIDDDPSMLCFVAEIFMGNYNVIPLNSAEEALKQLSIQLPNLIISDVMMPGMDGMQFARKIKSDKKLSHIPLILLSALNHIDEQTKGFESGAEAYITKPFHVEYLEKVVKRLLQREEDLKGYYNSILNAFELEDGHFLHKEDKSFFEQMMQVVDKQIANSELTVELLSNSLGYCKRQFYRKLKAITDKSPADIIKEYRLAVVERLLLTTQLSIEEIMCQTGFVNRGTFYKVFSQKFGMTPKQYRNHKMRDMQENLKE